LKEMIVNAHLHHQRKVTPTLNKAYATQGEN
jgi:hypothetical protein